MPDEFEESNVTSIPENDVFFPGDIVYLKMDHSIPNYGKFSQGHKFRVVVGVSKSASQMIETVEICDEEQHTIHMMPSNLTKEQP